jgi:NADP-dependent 3-hydroxy acid dehydrogenase YdfG
MNIIITGASSGIGFATALQLSQSPYHYVVAVSRNEEKLAELKQQADTLYRHDNLLPLVLDIETHDFSALKKQMDKLGEIHVLINNAGALLNKPFLELTDADYWKHGRLSRQQQIQRFGSLQCQQSSFG